MPQVAQTRRTPWASPVAGERAAAISATSCGPKGRDARCGRGATRPPWRAPGARSGWHRAYPRQFAPAGRPALGGVAQSGRGGNGAGRPAVEERCVRPLSADHGRVLELADAGGPQRPPGPAHHPHSRVPRKWSTQHADAAKSNKLEIQPAWLQLLSDTQIYEI